MDLRQIDAAIHDFERALRLDPRYALPYVGLAHARFWRYEAGRPEDERGESDLAMAIADAHRAIDLDPTLPEAFGALALMLLADDRPLEAVAARRRAVLLEPGNWRNHGRLAVAPWGPERQMAWNRVLDLYPDFAYAYYGIAMVHVGRGDLPEAEDWLRRGTPLQDRGAPMKDRFPGRGLHWLLGLVQLARGDHDGAAAAFDRELSSPDSDVYAAKFRKNAYEGHGFAHLVAGDPRTALTFFERALELAPHDPRLWLAMAAAHRRSGRLADHHSALTHAGEAIDRLRQGRHKADAVMAEAFRGVLLGRPAEAIRRLDDWLSAAPPGCYGWTLPVEPFLSSLRQQPQFQQLLQRLADRAS